MKKKLFFSVLVAAALASCTSDTFDLPTPGTSGPAVRGETPVGFSAYAERGVTRGGLVGNFDLTSLRKPSGEGGGFGVFAYYTDLKKYDQTYIPNFMYNQGVFDANEGAGDAQWEYSPVLYWPNEYGSDAQSDDEDKVSFFAYAPYVATTSAASGSVEDATYGITGFSRNTTVGDPLVKYIASFEPAKSVDLCWGVCSQATWAKIDGDDTQTMASGLPWLNVEHPKGIDQRMKFTFKHALAQLNVQIDADPDVLDHDVTTTIADGTKVYVRSISFTGIAMQGALNLNNTTANEAQWLDYSGTTDLPYGQNVTVKDGRRDGREGTSGAEANNETPRGLNSAIIQNSTTTPGVTNELQNLFQPNVVFADPANPTDDEIADALADPVYVIPTGEAMTVTIGYDIETASENLSGYLSDGTTHGISIENRVSKTITFGGVEGAGLTNGKKYTLKLHLGMNSVKFEGDISDWTATAVQGNGWLPSITGQGIYNPANPLSINMLNGEVTTLSGGQATKMTITGLQTGDPAEDNIAKMSAGNESEWSVSPAGVVQIAADPDAGVRAMTMMTRAAVDAEWSNSVSGASQILVKPVNAGQATISAIDHEGNKSTCVVTVNAPSITLDQSSLSLYKFNTPVAAENGTVTATLNSVEGITDALSSTVKVVTNYYQYYAADAATTLTRLPASGNFSESEGGSDDNKAKVVTAAIDTETGVLTITPAGIGQAKVIVSSETGATATVTVTVQQPTITLNTSALTLFQGGAAKSLTCRANPADDGETFTVQTTILKKSGDEFTTDDGSVITYDPATGKVTPVGVGVAKITFSYSGHTATSTLANVDRDPLPECIVTVLDGDPTTMKVGEDVMKTNPLWPVAQYNVAKPNFVTEEGADKGKPIATSFAMMTYHSTTAPYVFNWTCATDTINAMACAEGGSLAKYHVPTWAEQVAIIPSNNANTSGTNIFSLGGSDPYFEFPNGQTLTRASASGNGNTGDLTSSETETLKAAILAATGTGYFYRYAANDYYAVRIFGEVVTAWHYKRAANANGIMGLTIESYVMTKSASEITDIEAAKVILSALPDAEAWNATKNLSPADGDDNELTSVTTSLVSRFLPACGYLTGFSGTAVSAVGSNGYYWSATPSSGSNAFNWYFNSGNMGEYSNAQTYGLSVRLFRDE